MNQPSVCVVGLGKLGAPLAVHFAYRGCSVVGVDIDPDRVEAIGAGIDPFAGTEAGLADRLRSVHASGHLVATTDTAAAVALSEVVIVVVPLAIGVDRQPDFAHLDAATEAVGGGLRAGTTVIYETTLPVGTTRGRFAPVLADRSGLTLGEQLFVAHSPERVLTGRVFGDLARYPKLVGGIDDASTQRGVDFYEAVLSFEERPDLSRPNGVWPMASAEAAEFTKLAETTYRNVNIALVNEFARFADRSDIDIAEVIEAANSQPYSYLHTPGVSVGGHCIPVYPHLYLMGDRDAGLVEEATRVNDAMPEYVASQAERAHATLEGKTVAVLGIAYRPGVKEHAFSGVFALVDALAERGAHVVVDDPLYGDDEIAALGLTAMVPSDAARAEVVVVHTAHPEVLSAGTASFPNAKTIVDGRGVLDPSRWPGTTLVVLGAGSRVVGPMETTDDG